MSFYTTMLLVIIVLLLFSTVTASFEWSAGASSRPEVNRQAVAGLWRLTPLSAPMKEFTVYPKRPKHDENNDVLLMLKEDGSFQQYDTEDNDGDFMSLEEDDEDGSDLNSAWTLFRKHQRQKSEREEKRHQSTSMTFLSQNLRQNELKGVWNFVDGNLILAADRPKTKSASDMPVIKTDEKKMPVGSSLSNLGTNSAAATDTLLVGRVVASYEACLQDNPVLAGTSAAENTTTSSARRKTSIQVAPAAKKMTLDTRLSVPKGSVQVGRFFYPRNHPLFFEQPMFQPVRRGEFRLRQVLGTLNSKYKNDESEPIEKYQRKDFYNKTFLLTSHPLRTPTPKKQHEPWSPKSNQKARDATNLAVTSGVPIRVMQVQFHANNTFSTIAGLGDNTVLRGKFDIIGQDRDQLWMQIWRFGFGRSVSGSVYSEGRHLTHEDAKTYWGTIQLEPNSIKEGSQKKDSDNNEVLFEDKNCDSQKSLSQRLEVKGSVLFGWGLEPLPVARFIMREMIQQKEPLLEEEDDDDDDAQASFKGKLIETIEKKAVAEEGINWDDENAQFFQ